MPTIKALLQKYAVVLFLAGMSMIFAAVATINYFGTQNLISNSDTAAGTVVGLNYIHAGRGSAYHPVIRFSTQAGETIEGQAGFGSDPPSFHKGDAVQVYYRKDNPKDWILNGWGDLYFLPTMFGAAATILAIVSMVVRHYIRKTTPPFPQQQKEHPKGFRRK